MASALLYLLTIAVLSENNRRLTRIVADIASILNDPTPDVTFLYKFKVVGEPKVIAVASAQNNAAIDRIVNKLWDVGKIEINSQPIYSYESFARNLGVSDNLTFPVDDILQPENIYWVTVKIDYNNKTTEELLDIWKSEAETLLVARTNGDLRVVLYKNFAEREVPIFINAPEPYQLDIETFHFPLAERIGSDIRIQSKGLRFLNDCT